eukprot:444980-Pleurochrysis_carterae.AAC.1
MGCAAPTAKLCSSTRRWRCWIRRPPGWERCERIEGGTRRRMKDGASGGWSGSQNDLSVTSRSLHTDADELTRCIVPLARACPPPLASS